MKSSTLTALLCMVLMVASLTATRAEDGKVLAEFKPAADVETRLIAWFNTSDVPAAIKSRDVAQTFRASADGEITKLVFPMEAISDKGRPQSDVGDFAFTVTFYNHEGTVPAARFISKNNIVQPAKAEISTDGHSFIVSLDDPVTVIGGQIYTFALGWQGAAPNNRISLPQSPGTEEAFRWHRDNRGSWVRSPDSLQFRALGK